MRSTGRLRIRAATESDRPDLERTWLEPSVRRYLGGPISAGVLAERRRRPIDDGTFTVSLLDGSTIGFCRLGSYRTDDLELSYALLPEHWGNGYVAEACCEVLCWAAENIACDRVVGVTQSANLRSRRVLEKLGMTAVDSFEEWGEWQTMYAVDLYAFRS